MKNSLHSHSDTFGSGVGKANACLSLALVSALALAGPASANYRDASVQRAEVLSADPIVERVEVEVPREVCHNEQVPTRGYSDRYDSRYENRYGQNTRRSKTPGIVGAIVGGAIGNAVGNGKTNRRIGTAVGAILGGSIGVDISRRNQQVRRDAHWEEDRYGASQPVRYRTERVCRVERDYRVEEHISGFDVTYAYGGETYSTVLDHDPGRYLDVSVRVTPAG